MTLTQAQLDQLAAPLDPRRVAQREGSGRKSLSYLQSHDVKRTANRIFGYDGWSYTVDELVCLGEESYKNSKGREGVRVGYRATVTVTIGETRRGDTGYGDAVEYAGSRITPHELACKEAVSDATKRCLASWGDQFGLVLYGDDPIREAPAEVPVVAGASKEQGDTVNELKRALVDRFGVEPAKVAYTAARLEAGLVDGEWVSAEQADRVIREMRNALAGGEVPA